MSAQSIKKKCFVIKTLSKLRYPIKVLLKCPAKHNKDFMSLAYVCFYADDGDFDSFKGIWFRSNHAYKVLNHFAGIITPDFSLYQDFPLPLKL